MLMATCSKGHPEAFDPRLGLTLPWRSKQSRLWPFRRRVLRDEEREIPEAGGKGKSQQPVRGTAGPQLREQAVESRPTLNQQTPFGPDRNQVEGGASFAPSKAPSAMGSCGLG